MRSPVQSWVSLLTKNTEDEALVIKLQVLFSCLDKSGNVTDVHVTRSADPLLDEEAVRVIGASPKWRPGRMNGERVRTSMSIPVEFRLEKNGSFGINGRALRK